MDITEQRRLALTKICATDRAIRENRCNNVVDSSQQLSMATYSIFLLNPDFLTSQYWQVNLTSQFTSKYILLNMAGIAILGAGIFATEGTL